MKLRHFLQRFNCLLLLISSSVYGDSTTEDIHLAVSSYLKNHSEQLQSRHGDDVRIEYSIGHLDSRLRMAACSEQLVAEPNSIDSLGKVNIKVSCKGTSPWSIYVASHIDRQTHGNRLCVAYNAWLHQPQFVFVQWSSKG